MKDARRVALAVLVCVAATQGAAPVLIRGAADTRALTILQSELQRNFQMLKQQAAPAYFIGYTVHDERSTRLSASFGALERSDESAQPVRDRGGARRRLRARQHASDSRRCRGRWPPRHRASRCRSPTTSKPIRLALWRATDRTFKQATEALTRVKTNVAAKVKEDDPAPDFSREDAADLHRRHRQLLARHQVLGGAPPADLGALRRRPARSSAATSRCRSTPTTATTPTARAPRSRPATWRAASSSRRSPRPTTGWSCRCIQSYFASSPSTDCRTRNSCSPTPAA